MSANGTRAPFLVAGGGIGGLAVAVALAQKGYPVQLFEQAPEFGEVGAGIQLGPNFFRALGRLGLKEAALETAWQPNALVMRDALSGDVITRMPLGEAVRQRFGEPYAVIHRADIHSAILAAARAHPMVELNTSSKLASFEDDGAGVTVTLDDGRTAHGRALIGADGLWSQVRQAVVGDGKPRVSGHIAYRAVLKREDVPDDLWCPDVVLWAGPRTHLVHYPLRRGELFNLVAVFHSDKYVEGWDSNGDIDELMHRFKGERPEVLRLLERIETWRMWVLCDREPVRTWSRGRVAVIGDAAHPMLQYLAQGAGMAVEDAVAIADAVAASPDDLPGAFHTFSEARYLRTGRVQLMARFYGEFYHASGVAAELRSNMLGARPPEAAMEGMAWLYGGP